MREKTLAGNRFTVIMNDLRHRKMSKDAGVTVTNQEGL
jgi:hypothetical protein